MTAEEIEAIAPDNGSWMRGKKLANKTKWELLARKESIVWGLCKGSGGKPYQVQADLSEIGYKCSCPSRKFPCKHTIGLMLLHTNESHAFTEKEADDWVKEWIEKRIKSQSKKKAKEEAKPENEERNQANRAKTVAKRKAAMSAGITEMKDWLSDVVRLGLAELKRQPYTYFEEKGARFHDAKLPVLGNAVKNLHSQLQVKDWQIQSLGTLSWLYTVANGYQNAAELPEPLQADLNSMVGLNVKEEQVLKEGSGIKDKWLIVGKRIESSPNDADLKTQRTWLLGEQTQQYALLLDFSFRGAPFKYHFAPASIFEGELVFYPGSFPLRATVKLNEGKKQEFKTANIHTNFKDFLTQYAEDLSVNPFLSQYPFMVDNLYFNSKMEVFDEQKNKIPLTHSFKENYKLLALSGGLPITLFGEWQGQTLRPLSAFVDGKIHSLV